MEINTLFKGYFYPSSRVSRCPRFHACTVTSKCQNYDSHMLDCSICETRTNTHEVDPNSIPLGGHLPEGEYYPDLQDAVNQLERLLKKPFAHPDAEGQTFSSTDLANKFSNERKIVDMLEKFSLCGKIQMEEKIVEMLIDEKTKDLLGRLE